MRWVSRARPAPLRHLAVVREVGRAARGADRVYATTMVRRAALGAALARRPLVVKLVADEAYERERRSGRFAGTLEQFQAHDGGLRVRMLRATRNVALRRARQVLVPSAYLRDIALGWGLDSERVTVVPNPAPEVPAHPTREEARAALGIDGIALGTAGRLTVAEGARRHARRSGPRPGCRACSYVATAPSGPRSRVGPSSSASPTAFAFSARARARTCSHCFAPSTSRS